LAGQTTAPTAVDGVGALAATVTVRQAIVFPPRVQSAL
jgi:hypothetical protein